MWVMQSTPKFPEVRNVPVLTQPSSPNRPIRVWDLVSQTLLLGEEDLLFRLNWTCLSHSVPNPGELRKLMFNLEEALCFDKASAGCDPTLLNHRQRPPLQIRALVGILFCRGLKRWKQVPEQHRHRRTMCRSYLLDKQLLILRGDTALTNRAQRLGPDCPTAEPS